MNAKEDGKEAFHQREEMSGRDNQAEKEANSEESEVRDNRVLFLRNPQINAVGHKDGTRGTKKASVTTASPFIQLNRDRVSPRPIFQVGEEDTGR